MRTTQLIMLCVASGVTFGGCSMPRLPEAAVTAARPADQLVGKNLDALIAQLGPPARSSSADSDQTTIVWQFETPTGTPPTTGSGGLYGDGGSPNYVSQGYSPFCRITAIVSTSTRDRNPGQHGGIERNRSFDAAQGREHLFATPSGE